MEKENVTGCLLCIEIEYFDDTNSDGFPTSSSGWGCSFRDVDDFKTFPCKRKLKCFKPRKNENGN